MALSKSDPLNSKSEASRLQSGPRLNCSASYSRTKPSSSTIRSSTNSKYPNFIRPSINPSTQCNLWGPLCQTGTIVVDVNLTTTSTSTTVPCSSYLSAQSYSAQPPNHVRPDQYGDYMASFGRSPECTSYANYKQDSYAFNNKFKHTTKFPGTLSLMSLCGSITKYDWASKLLQGCPTIM